MYMLAETDIHRNGHLIQDDLNTSAALHNSELDPFGTEVDTQDVLR